MGAGDPPETTDRLDISKIPYGHEEVAEYLSDLRSGKSPEELLDEHIDRIANTDIRTALERLTLADTATSIVSTMDIPDDGIGLTPAQHSYLLGLLIVHSDSAATEERSYYKLAGPVIDICLKSMFADQADLSPDATDDAKLQAQVERQLKEQVFVVGEFLMADQPREAARRAYKPHDKYLKRELGFTIEQAISSVEHIQSVLSERRHEAMEDDAFDLDLLVSSGNTIDNLHRQFEKSGNLSLGSKSEDFWRDAGAIEEVYKGLDDNLDYFSVPTAQLRGNPPEDVSQAAFGAVVDRLSTTIGNTSNPDFRWPYQFNPLHDTPIVEFEDRYYTPDGNALWTALRKSFYYDLITLPDYGDPSGDTGGEFGNIYGDFLEDWTGDCLKKVFREEDVYQSPLHLTEGFPEACDVLVTGDETLFVVECKIGKIPLHLRDAGFEEIQTHIQSNIGKGYSEQALTLIQQIRDEGLDELVYNGNRFEIGEYDRYRPLIIVGEPYDGIATLLITVILETDDVSPFVIDIFDLQILTEYFDSPSEFEVYIEKRMELFDQRAIVSPDEIDYLGLYIRNDGEFPEIGEHEFMWVEDMSHTVGQEIDYKFGY